MPTRSYATSVASHGKRMITAFMSIEGSTSQQESGWSSMQGGPAEELVSMIPISKDMKQISNEKLIIAKVKIIDQKKIGNKMYVAAEIRPRQIGHMEISLQIFERYCAILEGLGFVKNQDMLSS